MKKITIVNKFLILLVLLFSLTLFSCTKKEEKDNNSSKEKDPGQDESGEEIRLTTTSYSILGETPYETTVYTFKSSKPGPKVFIMGGTHGDELAGWKAGLELVNKKDWQGEVMLIPQCSILADTLEQRYPGIGNNGKYQGVTYQDLNRNFPGKADGTVTEQIANAIITELIKFNPEYAIDLHESRSSASQGRVGETLIYGNAKKSALLADDIISDFNNKYIQLGENNFCAETNPPLGSFNRYCGVDLNIQSFTIETNRTLKLERRIEQQLQLLNIFFEYIWN